MDWINMGGYLANPRLSKKIRLSALPLMRFRQFVRPEPGYGKNVGDKIDFIRVSEVLTSGRAISEDEEVPETNLQITKSYLQVTEYANSIPYTGKLEALSEFDPENLIQEALRRDMAKTLDAVVGNVFRSTKYIYTPTGTSDNPSFVFTNTGTPGDVATRPISGWDISKLRLLAKGKTAGVGIPPYDGTNYMAICSVGAYEQIYNDPAFVEASKYGDPDRLFSGEVGRWRQIRFIEENNVLDDTLPANDVPGELIFFGEDPVVEGIVIPEEIRADIPKDFGRKKKLGWYYLGGSTLSFWEAGWGLCRVIRVYGASE